MKWICHADKDAILCGDRRISYDDLLGLTVHAGALMRPHCNPGDHVAILASNSPEWAIALYGAWHIGAVVVPIDFMSTRRLPSSFRTALPRLSGATPVPAAS